MFWNWYTIDTCFISSDWRVRSNGTSNVRIGIRADYWSFIVEFIFNVISVFILVALVEGVRRFGREYDRRIVRFANLRSSYLGSKNDKEYVALVRYD